MIEYEKGRRKVLKLLKDTTYKKVCFAETEYKGDYILKTPEEFYPCKSGYYSYLNMKPEMWLVFDELYDYFNADGYAMNTMGIYAYPHNIYWADNSETDLIKKCILHFQF